MPARTEMLGDRTISGKESLGVCGGLEPVHVSLSLASRLMRILCAVVEIPMLAMFHAGKNLALGGCVALQFVGDDNPRHVLQAFKQLAKEFLRGPLISATLRQDIEHGPLLLHRPPQIVTFSLERQTHLVHMPLVARRRTAATELSRRCLSEFAAPLANRLRGPDHAAFKQ